MRKRRPSCAHGRTRGRRDAHARKVKPWSFAVTPLRGYMGANPMMRGDRFLRNYSVAIFEEHRVSSERHLHVNIDAPSRTRLLSYIAGDLANEGIFGDCRGFSGSSGRVPGVERFLNYCLVPTESKWITDPSPMLCNCEIPAHITDASDKAKKKIIRKSSTLDDLLNFIESRPGLK